ncbi:F0F1 ATP synthase subunit gamma [Sphingorhabdus sp.]|jgi:F-type H+-transporting ATPase subunit gamma|uniref:F0F1 ATP synthase subunit gamma n=1 Tax=Sphingorhabdus sp. TaxID=1902408 RepID=UPI0035B24774|nr:F0F1 ATP synthase subunit gamma [Sphingomonadaceae bacterium]
MASLKALKIRINSVKSTQKITKAMKMVAAAKLKRAQEAAEASRPYAERLEKVVSSIASKVTVGPQSPKLLAGTGRDDVHLFVVATSDKGLAGAFNTNIVRLTRKRAEELRGQGKTVKFYTIGKKAKDGLVRFYRNDIVESVEPGDLGKLGYDAVKGWSDDLIARFEGGEFDVAHLFFNKFVSVLTQEPTELQLMPVALSNDNAPAGASASVEYEPDEEELLADLLPRNVAVQLLRANRENAASEQGSKMTAMDNATRNAGDMINKLTIQYNRTRQAAITTELVEIISGAEAL